MINVGIFSTASVSGVMLATLLGTGCGSMSANDPPAVSPPTTAPPTTAPPTRPLPLAPPGEGSAFAPPRGGKSAPDWSSTIVDSPAATSLKSLDGPRLPFLYAERRASEARDHLAMLVTIRHDKRGDVITLPCDRLVEPGQWAVTASGKSTLKELAPSLRDQDGHPISIQGYTDSLGAPDANDALSLLRAEAVRDYFTTQGVPADNMRAEGLGARRPLASNGTPEGRTLNRRIEIVIAPSQLSP